jgi:hypothetical protein
LSSVPGDLVCLRGAAAATATPLLRPPSAPAAAAVLPEPASAASSASEPVAVLPPKPQARPCLCRVAPYSMAPGPQPDREDDSS